ncbi:MAG: coproporphyrinogen dehydrogenase HemZ, partial [Ruminococcus sp.]
MMTNNQTAAPKPFPIALSGHTLKYEIECICKIFLPVTKFAFIYDMASLPEGETDGAVLTLEQPNEEQTRFFVQVTYHGTTLNDTQIFPKCDPVQEKALCEYHFSAMLFRILEQLTDLHPAWGLLTGIRPVKKVQPLLEQGLSKEQVCEKLREQYWIAPEKAELTYNTAVVQQPLLLETPKNAVSLYVSIPFCPTRCSYCSFVSHSVEQAHKLIPDYLDKLCEELAIWGDMVWELGLTIDTVYFGGGTPTSLTAEQLEQVLSAVQKNFDLSHLREYCVEAGRPDTITAEKLAVLRKYDISRI